MNRIILASNSPRRRELLQQLGIMFEIIPSTIEEEIPLGVADFRVAEFLAQQKAQDVALRLKEEVIIIGADTIVVHKQLLGKPKDKKDAFQMLKELQGKMHDVITGICVIDTESNKMLVNHERTTVKMATLDDDEILKYIETGEPMDKAGAYAIQGIGGAFIEEIHGCYYNVVGLPLSCLRKMLMKMGIEV